MLAGWAIASQILKGNCLKLKKFNDIYIAKFAINFSGATWDNKGTWVAY